jgi:signal transduction histidine kinase/ligand-binding sensor domain-containing protein
MSDPAPAINALIEGDHGTLLFSTRSGIRQLVDGKIRPYPLPVPQVKPGRMLRDRDGGLWIGTTDRGLIHLRQQKTDLFGRSAGLSGDLVESILEDREGNIWVATNGGLDRFRDFAVPTLSVNQGLSNASITSVLAARDGDVWLGTLDGLDRRNDGQITVYRKQSEFSPKREAQPLLPSHEITDSGLPDNKIGSLFSDDRGRIWVSTPHGVAYSNNGRFISVGGVPDGSFVTSIAGDDAGDTWITHPADGLIHLRQESVVDRTPWARLGGAASTIFPDARRGGLWLGFVQGGVAYFKDGQIRASYRAADGLGAGLVTGFQSDADGALWVSTEGGLSRIKDGRVATLTSKNGLPCDAAHWVIEDDAHSFWLYMACGLVRVARPELDAWTRDPKRSVQVTVFDTSDGVRSHAVYSGDNPRVAKSADGKIWFLPFDGVSVVDPRHLPFNKLPPPVHIEQITADRRIYEAPSRLRLPPLVRDLEIDYTALSLVAPEKVLFRYKLEGRDRDWKDVGTRRQAFYNNLSPGNYRFRVAACNNSGVWNQAGDTLDFSIAPAYYQTVWFHLACVAAFLASLWALYRFRLHQIAQEFDMRLEERVNERTRIARELHDTLLQSFHGLLLRFQAAVNLLPDRSTEAKQRLESAIDLAAQAITEGRDAVQDLRSTVVNSDLVPALKALGEELAADEGRPNCVASFIEVQGTPRNLHPILRDEIYRIGAEALRNAFRHAQARRIEVDIQYGERKFRLRVRDDGKGIDPQILHERGRTGHWGLPGMRERARRMSGSLDVWSELESGTEVELKIPAAIAYAGSPARHRFRLFSNGKETNS